MKENLNKRVFICYATEDKKVFVDSLAEALIKNNVDVWYSEYELIPGNSLREVIDRGITSCDIGIVVLSKNFFSKKWSAWELNGLVQRMVNGSCIIIPIYLGINVDDVMRHSPSLADIFAIKTDIEVDEIARKIHETIYPKNPILVDTRRILDSYGVNTPDYYDNWWIDRIEFSGRKNIFFLPWALPNNPKSDDSNRRAVQLSWACMRYNWIMTFSEKDINQFTDPKELYSIIENTPGMMEACLNNIRFVALYAPQLFFETNQLSDFLINEYEKSKMEIMHNKPDKEINFSITIDGKLPVCNRLFALCDKHFGGYTAESVLRHFVEGEQFGPAPSRHSYWTILIMLMDSGEKIYPKDVIDYLIQGYKERYACLQLKSIFVDKSDSFIRKAFSNEQVMKQIIEEITGDFGIITEKSHQQLAKDICGLGLDEMCFDDRNYRLTIPTDDLELGIRGITNQNGGRK